MSKIGIVDTTLRDGQQCLWATRMPTAMMLPIAERLDRAGLLALELMGAVQFDACVRFLKENPWERIRLMRERVTSTPLQALIRSKCILGFDLQPDDLSELWVERLVASGIRRFVAFDGLHDLDNLQAAVRRARELGAYSTGWLTFSESPVHTDDLYVAKAREFLDRIGVDALMIEDASGILTPERARTLVPRIKAEIGDVSLGLHSHGLLGLPQRTYIEAVGLGVDNVYVCMPPLADANAPPSVETTVRNLRYVGHEPELDLALMQECSEFLAAAAKHDGKPAGRPMDYDASFADHQIPGGVLSNLQAQLDIVGQGDRLPEILAESTQVRADLGWPIQVTPFAQLIGVQATLNVIHGERYVAVPDEVKKYALGYYGRLLAPVDPDVLDRIVERGSKRIALTPPKPEPVVARLRKRHPDLDDDELLLRHFFNPALVDEMQANKPDHDRFSVLETPLSRLLKELVKRPNASRIVVQKGTFKLELRN